MNESLQSTVQPPEDQKVKEAIQRLWSADHSINEMGRKEILQIGSATIAPLIKLLSDQIEDPHPRFATGKEVEGHQALNDYANILRRTGQPPGLDSKEDQAIYKLVINARLSSDAIFLLGELKAVEAIPILIHIMESPRMGLYQPVTMEMEALGKIGSPAIPFLFKSIENAQLSAAEAEPIWLGYYEEIDMGDVATEELANEEDYPVIDDPDYEQAMELNARELKRKGIKVLGEIGDKTALPFLESLSQIAENQPLAYDISAAIKRIKNEPSTQTSTGPQPPSPSRNPFPPDNLPPPPKWPR